MGEEGGLLAASETSYHKWRRGRLLQVCVLAPGEGSNAYGHARAMRTPLMTSRDSPDRRSRRRRLRDLYLHAWVARPWRPRRTDCMFPPGGAAPAVCGWRPPPRDSSSYTQNAAPAVGVHRPYIKRSCNVRRRQTYYWRYPRSHLTVDVRYFARTAARLRYAVRSSARLGLARPRARRARPPRDSRDPTAPVFDSCAGSAGNNV